MKFGWLRPKIPLGGGVRGKFEFLTMAINLHTNRENSLPNFMKIGWLDPKIHHGERSPSFWAWFKPNMYSKHVLLSRVRSDVTTQWLSNPIKTVTLLANAISAYYLLPLDKRSNAQCTEINLKKWSIYWLE